MIRSSTASMKLANRGKKNLLINFIDEYQSVVSSFVDLLWEEEKIPTLLPKSITSKINSWLSARAIQCAGKQASGIVRGVKKKQEKRLFMIDKFQKLGQHRKAKKLLNIYDNTVISKPVIGEVCPELDSRFVKIDLENETSFDGWVKLSSIGNKINLSIPFKRHKHFNKLMSEGDIKNGIRLSKKNITFMFDIADKKKEYGITLGIDIGQKNVISCSNGVCSTPNKHGHDLNTISKILSIRKKGSKAFKKSMEHRKNYINWTINQLNLDGVDELKVENIKHLRRGKKSSRLLSHWTYTEIFDKLNSKCEEQGVLVTSVSPTYTSQRCSACGWTRKSNRKGKLFKCGQCNFTFDADLNASMNIALPLKSISKQQRLKHTNRNGFYWYVLGQEPVVPVVQRT